MGSFLVHRCGMSESILRLQNVKFVGVYYNMSNAQLVQRASLSTRFVAYVEFDKDIKVSIQTTSYDKVHTYKKSDV